MQKHFSSLPQLFFVIDSFAFTRANVSASGNIARIYAISISEKCANKAATFMLLVALCTSWCDLEKYIFAIVLSFPTAAWLLIVPGGNSVVTLCCLSFPLFFCRRVFDDRLVSELI